MKFLFTFLTVIIVFISPIKAQKKTFVRQYTYQASEADSKLSARSIATNEIKNILLGEVGIYINSETVHNKSSQMNKTLEKKGKATETISENFQEKIVAITAGIVEMEIIKESWDGITYFIEAKMVVDPSEVNKRIQDILKDKEKTKELEETYKKITIAEKEIDSLRKEVEKTKSAESQKEYLKSTEFYRCFQLYRKACDAYENKSYELTEEYCFKMLEIRDDYPPAYQILGDVYYITGDYNKSLKNYQKVIELNSEYTDIYYKIGQVYTEKEEYNQAIYSFRKNLLIDPKDAYSYYYIGNAYLHLAINDKAEYDSVFLNYKKAIALDKNNSDIYRSLGSAYSLKGDYDNAIFFSKKAISLNSKDVQAYWSIGSAYDSKAEYDNAILWYKKALVVDPKYLEALRCMRNAYDSKGDYNLAIICNQRIINIYPNYANSYSYLGFYYYEKVKDIEQAIIYFKKAANLGDEISKDVLIKLED